METFDQTPWRKTINWPKNCMWPWILILGKEPKFQRNRTGAIQEIAHPENWGKSQIKLLSPQGPYPTDSMWLWYARARDHGPCEYIEDITETSSKTYSVRCLSEFECLQCIKKRSKIKQEGLSAIPLGFKSGSVCSTKTLMFHY